MKIFIILVSGKKKKKNTIVSISIPMFVSFFAQLNNYYVQRTIQQLVKLAPCTMKKKKKKHETTPIRSSHRYINQHGYTRIICSGVDRKRYE